MKKLRKKLNKSTIVTFQRICLACYREPDGSTDYYSPENRYTGPEL